jgi:hypothetical protein
MIPFFRHLKEKCGAFYADERGVVTVEFVIVFPVFFSFFLMAVESGMFQVRQVVLDRGVEVAIRDVRIGRITNPAPDALVPTAFRALVLNRICEAAAILPKCLEQTQLEMIILDPRDWDDADIPADIECIDRSVPVQPTITFTNGESNDLVFLRACIRIDPFFPTTGLGKAVIEGAAGDDAADGSMGLVSVGFFAVEPTNSGGT